MRRRLTRYATAAVLAAVVALPTGVRPVQANPVATVAAVISVVKEAYALWKDYKQGNNPQATAQILAAISEAKTAILTHADELAAADARACTTHAAIEAQDVTSFDPVTL